MKLSNNTRRDLAELHESWADFWNRLRHNPLSILGAMILAFGVAYMPAAPWLGE